MQGGGPSPSGSNFRHSYGFAAVSKAQTSARGRFPEKNGPCYDFLTDIIAYNGEASLLD